MRTDCFLKFSPDADGYPIGYEGWLIDFIKKPNETFVYVPFQSRPNLPGLKINTLEMGGRTLYHGITSQTVKGTKCIPIFTNLDDIKPSYGKYFEMIYLPIGKVVDLISDDSSAQGLMLDTFTLNVILGDDWVEIIKESGRKN